MKCLLLGNRVYLVAFIFLILQGPFIDYFVETANEHPYLWGLYALVVVLPFVACAACCVRSKVRRKLCIRCKLAMPVQDVPCVSHALYKTYLVLATPCARRTLC